SVASVLERDEILCQAIGDAMNDWPEEGGAPAARLSVAMALYHSGEIDRQCLAAELENLHIDDESALAYLGRAIVFDSHADLSARYMDRVCEASLTGEECSVIQARAALQREEWAAFRHVLGQ